MVKDALKEKVDEIEAEQMRKVYKKERDQLKDDIVQAFLPRAFIRKSTTFAAIAPSLGLVLVDSSSAKRAEDLLSTLREAIGSLPVRPLTVKVAPAATLTEWLKTQQAAADFTVLDECELRDTHEDGGVVRCKRQDLSSDEIQNHLAPASRSPSSRWPGRTSCPSCSTTSWWSSACASRTCCRTRPNRTAATTPSANRTPASH